MERRTAVVTGASRGIGKASAIALAQKGFDVAITARTMLKEDQSPEPSGLSAETLPGSLEETAEIIRSFKVQAFLSIWTLWKEIVWFPLQKQLLAS